jgi:multiple sugar transport system permease protein
MMTFSKLKTANPHKIIAGIGLSGGIFLWLTFILFPYIWMFITSIKSPQELYTSPICYFPAHPTFDGYRLLLKTTHFPRYLLNSLAVAFGTVTLMAFVATSAAYCFSRLEFWGKKQLTGVFLISQMFPSVLLVLSLYFIMKSLGLLNSLLALIIADCTFALPFTVWLLNGFLNAIPRELDEAATIDGANRLQTFRYVILPLAAPGIVAALTYVFIFSWNEFIYALTFTSDTATRTLPIGLHTFMGEYIIRWDLLTAGGVLTGIPIVIFFMIAQKYLVEGLTAGAVKG